MINKKAGVPVYAEILRFFQIYIKKPVSPHSFLRRERKDAVLPANGGLYICGNTAFFQNYFVAPLIQYVAHGIPYTTIISV